MERFTGRAEAYAAARPSYPGPAIDALLAGLGEPHALRVADLGAGTGISARALAERGAHVVAIEPNAAMRDAAAADDRIVWSSAAAEATGLSAASVDLVTAFQAWHWFEHERAVAEARRIVRPGGRIAVISNERDESDSFTAAYGALIRGAAVDDTEHRRAEALERVAALSGAVRREFLHGHDLDGAGLRARLASTSYVPHDGRAADDLVAALDALFARYAVSGVVRMCLTTTIVALDC